MDLIMEEQVSQALSRVKSILSDVKLSITSVPSEKFLPIISDILSEITEVVACAQQVDAMSVDQPDDDLWWDSNPECVNYSDSDEEHSMVSTIPFSSVNNGSLSSLSLTSSDDQPRISSIKSFPVHREQLPVTHSLLSDSTHQL